MPTSACCSAITSGVAIRSVDLHSNHAVLDEHREGVDGHVRRQVQGLSGAQVETRPVPRAFDRAIVLVELAVDELAVVVRAAVLDGEDLALAVDNADLEVLPHDETLLARWQVFEGADVDQRTHGGQNPIAEVWILSTARRLAWADGSQAVGGDHDVRGAARRAHATALRGRAAAARDGARNAVRAGAGARGRDPGGAAAPARRRRAVAAALPGSDLPVRRARSRPLPVRGLARSGARPARAGAG